MVFMHNCTKQPTIILGQIVLLQILKIGKIGQYIEMLLTMDFKSN